MSEQRIGTVEHYYPKAHAAVIRLEDDLRVGDEIRIRGATTDFKERVRRIEVDHEKIQAARPGTEVGVQVEHRVREHDEVFRVA